MFGCADDSFLLTSNFHLLSHFLHLTMLYCHKYKVIMTPEKTKLQVFAPPALDSYVEYYKSTNYLSISGVPLSFTNNTEHVGVIRSPLSGNIPHILQRISSHKSALVAVFSAGLSRSHRGNPAAFVRRKKAIWSSHLIVWTRISLPPQLWDTDTLQTLQANTWRSS